MGPVIATTLLLVTSFLSLIYSNTDKQNTSFNQITNVTNIMSNKNQDVLSAQTTNYVVVTETPVPTATPTPIPLPTATPIPPTPIPLGNLNLLDLFQKYSNRYGVDLGLLEKIARCESNFHASSQNGIYAGLFQFSESAWKTERDKMGLDNDIALRFNPEEAIKTAAFKIKNDGTEAWHNCSK